MHPTPAPRSTAPQSAAPPPGALPPAARPPAPPPVPDRFWDGTTGTVRVEELLSAYLELERMLATVNAGGLPPTAGVGVPDSPEGYCIACDHGLFDPDPEINSRLHAAGYSQAQSQLLYDLAAERLVPMLQELAAQFQSDREMERLVAQFGGEDRWRAVSRQILAWATRNLPPAAVNGLSTTYDGVMALHRMMTGAEPAALRGGPAPAGLGAADLTALIRDPRYWRDRDPATVARVTEGFRRLYPDA